MVLDIQTATDAAIAPLPPPGGALIDTWNSPLAWGEIDFDFDQPTRISLVAGGGPGERFAVIEQAPDARVFLGEDEIQRAIAALSIALVALRGFELADKRETA